MTETAAQMPRIRSRAAAVARSRTTNRWLLPGDQRGSWHRRRIDLIREFIDTLADQGREPTARDKVTIGNAAACIVRTEMLTAQMLAGQPIYDDQLTRLANLSERLLTSLGLRSAAEPAPEPERSPEEELWAYGRSIAAPAVSGHELNGEPATETAPEPIERTSGDLAGSE